MQICRLISFTTNIKLNSLPPGGADKNLISKSKTKQFCKSNNFLTFLITGGVILFLTAIAAFTFKTNSQYQDSQENKNENNITFCKLLSVPGVMISLLREQIRMSQGHPILI